MKKLIFILVIFTSRYSQADDALDITVSSTPLKQTTHESSQSVSVISEDDLRTKAGSNLGQTLSSEPGITNTSFGPGAGRPIIRGLDGERIRILENGVGTLDVSGSSPDHAVMTEASQIKKIEIVRGPASILYGTTAVGGVVSIFDNRIPEALPERPVVGVTEFRTDSASNERTGVASLDTGAGNFAFHIDGFKKKTDDIDLPNYARTLKSRIAEPDLGYSEPKGKLPFSATESDNATFGTSYIQGKDFLGASVSNFNNLYGVPNGEKNISIGANRKRLDIKGKLYNPSEGFELLEFKAGAVDYDHTEFEDGAPGTKFQNTGVNSRLELTHKPIDKLHGLIGLESQVAQFSALGEEAYQAPSNTETTSGFLFEEYDLAEKFRLQFGGRADYQSTRAQKYTRDYGSFAGDPYEISKDFLTESASTGIVYLPTKDYTVTTSLSFTERAPNAQELYAHGPHVATNAFLIGNPNLDTEKSVGIDITARKIKGTVTGSIGTFYNRFQNFIGVIPQDIKQDDLQVFDYMHVPAEFYGIESQIAYHFLDQNPEIEDFSVDLQPDFVIAKNTDTNEDLPRTPPVRIKAGINYNVQDLFRTRLEALRVLTQNNIATYETDTSGYTSVNFTASKDIKVKNVPVELFLRGQNLLNETIREHTSFIKDLAPLPGASVMVGVRVRF